MLVSQQFSPVVPPAGLSLYPPVQATNKEFAMHQPRTHQMPPKRLARSNAASASFSRADIAPITDLTQAIAEAPCSSGKARPTRPWRE